MKCKPSKRAFDAEWFHDLLREAHGVSSEAESTPCSELHRTAKRMAEIMEERLQVSSDSAKKP